MKFIRIPWLTGFWRGSNFPRYSITHHLKQTGEWKIHHFKHQTKPTLKKQTHDMTFTATHYLLWCLNWWLISSTSFSIFSCLDRGCLFMVEASFFDRLLPLNIHQKPRNASIFLGKIWRNFGANSETSTPWGGFPSHASGLILEEIDPEIYRATESFQNLGFPGTCMWLIIRVIVSPLTGILPLPNGLKGL